MTKKTLSRTILALVITGLLGGASLIIARSNSNTAAGTAPSGFFH
jgi:hypothetical protein